jgi:hypothetical protein
VKRRKKEYKVISRKTRRSSPQVKGMKRKKDGGEKKTARGEGARKKLLSATNRA